MDNRYHNVMEDLVEEKYENIKGDLHCCTCPQCKNDIIAYALNKLPGKYVVTPTGAAYSKVYALSLQHDADILSALAAAASIVGKYPRH